MFKLKYRIILTALLCCLMAVLVTCSVTEDHAVGSDNVTAIADQVWSLGQTCPDGFTVDVRTMQLQTEGIAVSYAATQSSHTREQLEDVVTHALHHDGYVGGWYDSISGRYYFDSSRLYPDSLLGEAVRFGLENGQQDIYILTINVNLDLSGKVAQVVSRDTLYVGTTGDYRPLSFCEPVTGEYWGFGIEMAREIAARLGVNVKFVKTSWPTLTEDVLSEPQLFDMAIGGITITDARKETMMMSDGYLGNGKTILCRATDAGRFRSLDDVDKPEVRVMVNPGGLNEKFANQNLKHARIIVHPRNEEIPSLIARGDADVMITEITEAPYYVNTDTLLAAPLLNTPFTHGEIGVLMQKGQDDLILLVNSIIRKMKADGSLRRLHDKYGLVYVF